MGQNRHDTSSRVGTQRRAAVASVPHGHWKTTTFLAGLRTTGLTAPLVVDGAINGDIFLGWVTRHLAPTLQPGDIMVMKNLRAHKVTGVREAIAAVGARVLYLPPYSPNLNPIELVFSKFKWLLKSASARTVDSLWALCRTVIDTFTETECRNCFRHCGYRNTSDGCAPGRFAVGTQHVPDCLDHVSKARGIEHAARAAIQRGPRYDDHGMRARVFKVCRVDSSRLDHASSSIRPTALRRPMA